jgi:hypothetical protein
MKTRKESSHGERQLSPESWNPDRSIPLTIMKRKKRWLKNQVFDHPSAIFDAVRHIQE